MAKTRKKTSGFRIEGLILPREDNSLGKLWDAFQKGPTWDPKGKRSSAVRKYTHTAYKGWLLLEWWGRALHFTVEDPEAAGRIAGAFLGHVQRHGQAIVDRVDFRFVWAG